MAKTATITSSHRVRNEVRDYLEPVYFEDKVGPLWEIDKILKSHGFQLDENFVLNFQDDDGNQTIPIVAVPHGHVLCDCCNKPVTVNNCVSYSWYKMQSGRFEITSYIS